MSTKDLHHLFCIIHLPPWFLSLCKEEPLNCFHRCQSLAILGQAGPWWQSKFYLHHVFGLPCRLVNSRGFHSVTLLVVLCIVSMILYDTYRRYIDPIHDKYHDTYRIIYSIKNIAETVIKTQHTNTCMHKICAVNRSHQPRC